MNGETLEWALRAQTGEPGAKLLLVHICNDWQTGRDGRVVFPLLMAARRAQVDETRARRELRLLEDLGYIDRLPDDPAAMIRSQADPVHAPYVAIRINRPQRTGDGE